MVEKCQHILSQFIFYPDRNLSIHVTFATSEMGDSQLAQVRVMEIIKEERIGE